MVTPALHDEKALVSRLGSGCGDAFTRLFDLYQPRVRSAAMRMLRSKVLAEEVTQEVFLKVWSRRQNISMTTNFKGYFHMMVRNCVYDIVEKIGRERAINKDYADLRSGTYEKSADVQVWEDQCNEILRRTIDSLPPQQKRIFHLAKHEGLSYRVIALQLGISEATVKSHMRLALETIRYRLTNSLN